MVKKKSFTTVSGFFNFLNCVQQENMSNILNIHYVHLQKTWRSLETVTMKYDGMSLISPAFSQSLPHEVRFLAAKTGPQPSESMMKVSKFGLSSDTSASTKSPMVGRLCSMPVTHTHTNTGIRGCLQAARSGTRISLLFSITASHFIHAFLSAEIFLIWCQRSDHKKGKEKPFVFWDPLKQVLHFFFPN